jgi:hypothetical protein
LNEAKQRGEALIDRLRRKIAAGGLLAVSSSAFRCKSGTLFSELSALAAPAYKKMRHHITDFGMKRHVLA